MDESVASQQSHDTSTDDIPIPNDISNGKKPGGKYRQGYLPHRNDYLVPKLPASLGGVGDDTNDPIFRDHVKNLRGTMFYVCQGSCLCGTVNNRGKVIYCYGDLVPRQGEMFAEGGDPTSTTSSKDLLIAQLGLWAFGILALLVILILIRKSLNSMRRHLIKMTERLPLYHDDDLISNHSATSPPLHGKDTTMDTMDPTDFFSDEGTLTPDPHITDDSPEHVNLRGGHANKNMTVEKMRTLRLHRKDFKKGGEALRGKNVTEGYRIKEKDMKRTLK